MVEHQCQAGRPRCRLPATAGTCVRHLSTGTHTWGMQIVSSPSVKPQEKAVVVAIVGGSAGDIVHCGVHTHKQET